MRNTDALTCLSKARARRARLADEIKRAANGGAFATVDSVVDDEDAPNASGHDIRPQGIARQQRA
jgi:hypothetical protein